MDAKTQKKIEAWLQEPFDAKTREAVIALKNLSPKELEDCFYTDLSFGTGGLRGLMGVGTNRMNCYTVRKTTQGLASYLKKQFSGQGISVVIGFDNRLHSEEFAKEASQVLLLNGIDVFLCAKLRPTPYVSFSLRHCKAHAAIMITASHNPKEYNGYKVYWQDGAQVVAPHDSGILDEISKITDFNVYKSSHPGTLHILDDKLDMAYLDAIRPLNHYPEENAKEGKNLSIVYTSLHGTGITLVPKALQNWGFTSLTFVSEQIIVDGNFPTTPSPNPESSKALKMGIDLLEKVQGDILLATDPDADRVGITVLHKGKPISLNGNEIAALCTEYLCQRKGPMLRPAVVTTIVSTDLIRSICQAHGVICEEVLTGFKYIGEKIHLWEQSPSHRPTFLFGAEESYGYLCGTHSRDKDAVVSCCLLAEMALFYKKQGKTLVDALYSLYNTYGIFTETTVSLDYPPGQKGIQNIQKIMEALRFHDITTLCSLTIEKKIDYLDVEKTSLPSSNVLCFILKKGYKVIVRPSGTEPKLKIYTFLHIPLSDSALPPFAEVASSLSLFTEALLIELKNL
jgi:phosphoglucomutase/phosphomannomutase